MRLAAMRAVSFCSAIRVLLRKNVDKPGLSEWDGFTRREVTSCEAYRGSPPTSQDSPKVADWYYFCKFFA